MGEQRLSPAFSRIAAVLAHLLASVSLLGAAVRLTTRDEVDGLAVFFYATPWPLLAGCIGASSIWWTCCKRWTVAAICAVFALAFGLLWFRQSWVRNSPGDGAAAFRVFLWNAEHPKRRLAEVIEVVRAADADIIAITETESTMPADRGRWTAAFPGHTIHGLPGGMLVLARAERVAAKRYGRLARGSRYHTLDLQLQGRKVRLIFVDFSAAPLRSRRPAFQSLHQILRENVSNEIILVGDFNTPRESVHFDELRKRLQHAFETRGDGYAETWPVPFPVLSLDHVWASSGLRISRCLLGWAAVSDHRPVIVDFAWGSDGGDSRPRAATADH